ANRLIYLAKLSGFNRITKVFTINNLTAVVRIDPYQNRFVQRQKEAKRTFNVPLLPKIASTLLLF
ncbi:MAG: hypothetical protein PHV03_07255, partial [Desulfitobacteriaceae bacterium]|nr:hypothetical protein [Desulfitobacteriaceae bacterium]MDD4402736.1 hypothetical protein [Desulfitobacteriaceae bacterium]